MNQITCVSKITAGVLVAAAMLTSAAFAKDPHQSHGGATARGNIDAKQHPKTVVVSTTTARVITPAPAPTGLKRAEPQPPRQPPAVEKAPLPKPVDGVPPDRTNW